MQMETGATFCRVTPREAPCWTHFTDLSLISSTTLGKQLYYLHFTNEQIKRSCGRTVNLPQVTASLRKIGWVLEPTSEPQACVLSTSTKTLDRSTGKGGSPSKLLLASSLLTYFSIKWSNSEKKKKKRRRKEKKTSSCRFWFRIKGNFSERYEQELLPVWAWGPSRAQKSVIPASFSFVAGCHHWGLNHLHFPIHRLLGVVSFPLLFPGNLGPLVEHLWTSCLLWRTKQAWCQDDVLQCQRHNYWNQMETKNDNSCEAPQVTQASFSEYLNRFHCNWVGAKGLFLSKLSSGRERGGEEEERAAWDQSSWPLLCLWPCLEEAGEGAQLPFVPSSFSKYILAAMRTPKSMTEWLFERQAVADG